MTLLITVNKKRICNVAFISIISKIIISKAFKYCPRVMKPVEA